MLNLNLETLNLSKDRVFICIVATQKHLWFLQGLVWPVPLAQMWTCYDVWWTQNMTLFCKVYLYPIARSLQQCQRHITIPSTWIEWQTFKCSNVQNWFLLPKLGFLEFIWIFSGRNHFKINICHILNSKLTK